MDVSVSPIVRGKFLYRDVLLVDLGELKRHPRASEAEIKRLLNGKDIKDQVGHWWGAQLIHYGLQRSKVKDTAKVRLQQALNQGKLKAQPAHLADMELSMQKEYASAVRKAKAQAKPQTPKGTKRARDGESVTEPVSKKSKITVRVGDVSIDVDQSTFSTVAGESRSTATLPKQAKKSKKEAAGSNADAQVTPRSNQSKSQSARPDTVKKKKAKSEYADEVSAPAHDAPKATKKSMSKSQSSPARATPIKSEANNGLNRNSSQPVKTEAVAHSDLPRDQVSVTGVYELDCPQLAAQAPDHADKLRLFICVDNENGLIWGGFELAWKSGVIKIDDVGLQRHLSLGWRSRDYETNELKFGKGCFGEVFFNGAGGVQGVLHGLFPESIHFEGSRRPGPLWCGRSAYSFKKDWDQYPREAYGR